jgi:hypothetical protein
MRLVLNAMPLEDRESIARMYTGGDKNNIAVAAEYMARLSETDPNIGPLQGFYGKLKGLARLVGKEMRLSQSDMGILANGGIFDEGTEPLVWNGGQDARKIKAGKSRTF